MRCLRLKQFLIALAAALVVAACSTPGVAPSAGTATGAVALPDFTALIESQGPSVVNVVTSRAPRAGEDPLAGLPDDPFFDFFRRFIPLPDEMPAPQGLGAGFIISSDGIILTNAHVVADAESVTVRLADDKREFEGKVLGSDRRTDIAVVKIDATDLPVARLGSSKAVKPGEWVAAIGSPFGFSNTITAGIVSATERALPQESFVPLIQTDVAVNPGNSGGPLLNVRGEVIGINSMIYSRTGGYMGVSFAIPIEVALDVAQQLRTRGKVTRGRIGVAVQPVTAELAQAFRLDSPTGALIGQLEAGGPAARAGLKSGDIILAYNGEPIEEFSELPRRVAASPPGSEARIDIWRDGARRRFAATVGELVEPETQAADRDAGPEPEPDRFGLVLEELSPEERRQLDIDFGLRVERLAGAAARSRLRRGDVITAINDRRFSSQAEFDRLMAQVRPGAPIALLVRRGESYEYIALEGAAGKEAG